MTFQTRHDAYAWSESSRPQGPCGVVIANGGFTHLYLLEAGCELLYLGMRAPARDVRRSRRRLTNW
jgi:hypothetical protein